MATNEVLMEEAHTLVHSIKLPFKGAPAFLRGLEFPTEESDRLPLVQDVIELLQMAANGFFGGVTGESKLEVGVGVSKGRSIYQQLLSITETLLEIFVVVPYFFKFTWLWEDASGYLI